MALIFSPNKNKLKQIFHDQNFQAFIYKPNIKKWIAQIVELIKNLITGRFSTNMSKCCKWNCDLKKSYFCWIVCSLHKLLVKSAAALKASARYVNESANEQCKSPRRKSIPFLSKVVDLFSLKRVDALVVEQFLYIFQIVRLSNRNCVFQSIHFPISLTIVERIETQEDQKFSAVKCRLCLDMKHGRAWLTSYYAESS